MQHERRIYSISYIFEFKSVSILFIVFFFDIYITYFHIGFSIRTSSPDFNQLLNVVIG